MHLVGRRVVRDSRPRVVGYPRTERLMDAEHLAAWRGLLRTGMWAAWGGVALIAVQMGVFLTSPPPGTTADFYELLIDDPVLGALSLDALYVLSNTFAYLVYLALGVLLWRTSRSAVVVALALGTLGMAAYMASPRFVEMLSLAHTYADADADERVALLATGDGMLATWTGTAFDVYYVFNAALLVIMAVLLLRSRVTSRATGWWAMAAAVLMMVPSNVGVVGLVFAVASLVPWVVFSVLLALRLQVLTREPADV